MARKQSETKWRKIMKDEGWFWHKYGDVRYCMHCHKPLPKTENAPDFVVAPVVTYVECKNSDKTGRWNWTEIAEDGARKNQREWLIEHEGWLFIELGTGKAPKGRQAYLIPIIMWIRHFEPKLRELGMSSIRKETRGKRPGADDLLGSYALKWITLEGWTIPENHAWWRVVRYRLHKYSIEKEWIKI